MEEQMRDMKDAREGMGKTGRGKTILLIGLLGLLIFILLFLFFGRGGKNETMVASNESKMDQKTPSPAIPRTQNEAPKTPQTQNPEPGKVGISEPTNPETTKPVPPSVPLTPATPAPEAPTPSPKEQASTKKEDFTFFKTLKGTEPPAPLHSQEKPAPSVALHKDVPKETTKPSVSKRYTIQVAALNVEKPARLLAEKLKKRGFPSYVVKVQRPELGTIYRVRVGHFSSLPEAKRVAEQIRERERLTFFITMSEG
jgi:cell division septation protein DedD